MKKIILYFISGLLVCSCTRYQIAINASSPNINHYTLLLKNVSSDNNIMYSYYLDNLVREKKVTSYNVKDSADYKLIDIVFSNRDSIVITNILRLKEKKKKPSEQLLLANYTDKLDTVYLRSNGKVLSNKFVMISQKKPLYGYNFYPATQQ